MDAASGAGGSLDIAMPSPRHVFVGPFDVSSLQSPSIYRRQVLPLDARSQMENVGLRVRVSYFSARRS